MPFFHIIFLHLLLLVTRFHKIKNLEYCCIQSLFLYPYATCTSKRQEDGVPQNGITEALVEESPHYIVTHWESIEFVLCYWCQDKPQSIDSNPQ
jgi:hypothetical protein